MTPKPKSLSGDSSTSITDNNTSYKELQSEKDANGQASQGGTIARQDADNFRLPSLQAHQHSSLLYLSLLEGRCRTQAAKAINAGRRPEDKLLEDHPEVCELGRHLFAEMTRELSKAGVLPKSTADFTGQDIAQLRNGYLTRFDNVLDNLASKRSPDIPDRSAYESIDKSSIFSITEDLSTPLEISDLQALALAPFAMPSDMQKRLSQDGRHSPLSSLIPLGNKDQLVSKSVYATSYKELSLLGKGGFGEVWRVLNRVDEQEYAVKKVVVGPERLRKMMIKDEDYAKLLLLSEVKTLASLHHPNIVRYHSGWIEWENAAVHRRLKAAGDQSDVSFTDEATDSLDMKHLQLADDDPDDDGIVFGDSSKSIALAASPISKPSNLLSEHASTGKQKSSVHGLYDESSELRHTEDNGEDSAEDISRSTVHSPEPVAYNLIVYAAMELHPLTLENYLSCDQPKPNESNTVRHCFHTSSSARLLNSILDGVQYIHHKRIIHRDLKPTNIFLSIHDPAEEPMSPFHGSIDVTNCLECRRNDNSNSVRKQILITPCIGDFGLIAEIKDPQTTTSTPTASSSKAAFQPSPMASMASPRAGTTLYCPPKIASTEQIICPKLDVFSLGVIAFELVNKFNTKSERHFVLSQLNRGILPESFRDHRMATGIKNMICADREKRWDCNDVRGWVREIISEFQ